MFLGHERSTVGLPKQKLACIFFQSGEIFWRLENQILKLINNSRYKRGISKILGVWI